MSEVRIKSKFDRVEKNLQTYKKLKNDNLWLYYSYYEPGERQVEVFLDGKKFLLFSTNNYLGLARNKNVIKAAIDAAQRCGVGTGASMAVSGGTIYHKKLEEALANFYNAEDCVILSSGFMANSAIITTFAADGLKVFCDKYLHVSFINSLKLHEIEPIRFEHDDVNDLEQKMQLECSTNPNAKSIIITESVFSQHGEIAKVNKISTIAKKYNATLIVDDAHGLGTIGDNGYGILEHYNLSLNDIPVITGAMNKSLGSQGGYIVSSRQITEMVRMKAYELIFTSSLPAMSMAAAHAALLEIKSDRNLFRRLRENIIYARECLQTMGAVLTNTLTPIIPIIVGSEKKASFISKMLKDNGIVVIAIIPPAVPEDKSRLRIQITSEHTKDDIDRLIFLLRRYLK